MTFIIKDHQKIRARTHQSSSSEQAQLEDLTHYLESPLRQPTAHDKPETQARRSSSHSPLLTPMRISMITKLPPVGESMIITVKGSHIAPEGPGPVQPVSINAKQGRMDPRFGGPRADPSVPHRSLPVRCQSASFIAINGHQPNADRIQSPESSRHSRDSSGSQA